MEKISQFFSDNKKVILYIIGGLVLLFLLGTVVKSISKAIKQFFGVEEPETEFEIKTDDLDHIPNISLNPAEIKVLVSDLRDELESTKWLGWGSEERCQILKRTSELSNPDLAVVAVAYKKLTKVGLRAALADIRWVGVCKNGVSGGSYRSNLTARLVDLKV